MSGHEALNLVRPILTQEASITAIRAIAFLFAAFAAIAWLRGRPLTALLASSLGGSAALAFWLIQLVSPLGFGTDPVLTLDWAQAGVSAAAEPPGAGLVWGTDPQPSLIATLGAAGIPFEVLSDIPAVFVLLTFASLIVLPFLFFRNRSTAALAASVVIGGGLWPGMAPYGPLLGRPVALVVGWVAVSAIVLASRRVRVGRAFHRSRLWASFALVATAALDRAMLGGGEPSATAALSLCAASVILVSPIRAALRRLAPSALSVRGAEALLLLCVTGGSGLVWWDPPRSVKGFREARDENLAFRRPMEWLRQHVPAKSVVLASPLYSAPVGALAGRRVLFAPPSDVGVQTALSEPFRRARLAQSTREGRPIERLATAFGVTHLFLGPGEPSPPLGTDTRPGSEPAMTLVPVYQDAADFRIFRLVRK
jgi:hypothetical protein